MKKRILVIDDEKGIRKSFVLALEDTEYEVDGAESGMKGISLHKEKKYDLIYLDLKMPGLNGVETLQKIRATDGDVPIYIITAFYEEFFTDLKKAHEQGLYFEVLKKPIDLEQILFVTKCILEGPGQEGRNN